MFEIWKKLKIISEMKQFIRKHSVDEQPQLFNGFIWHVSSASLCPELPCEVTLCDEYATHHLAVESSCDGPW